MTQQNILNQKVFFCTEKPKFMKKKQTIAVSFVSLTKDKYHGVTLAQNDNILVSTTYLFRSNQIHCKIQSVLNCLRVSIDTKICNITIDTNGNRT